VGVNGWEAIVYKAPGVTSDSPLPMAMGHLVAPDNVLYKMLVGVGIFGLIASFHGLILASGRATFEFGRVGFAPRFLGEISPRFLTPANALIFNTLIGICALLAGKTGEIITFSVLGALVLYIISMIAILRLRKSEPDLVRPFKVPFFPATPIIALIIAVVSFVAMVWYNLLLSGLFFGIILAAYIIFKALKLTSTDHDQ
jgi:ethanolamine permease